jgi:hypothetical protein
MEQNIFQNTLARIRENFPERKDALILLLVDKPGDERIRLMAQQPDGYKDCLQISAYTNRKVMVILAALREEFASLETDPASTDQWDAVALLIEPDGEMQISFDDDRILDHWNRPEFIFYS